jgi:hypothetical protein
MRRLDLNVRLRGVRMSGAEVRKRRVAVSSHRLHAGRLRLAAVFVCLLMLVGATQASAATAPGGLDPSFGVGGVALTSIGDGNAQATAVAPDPDGASSPAARRSAIAHSVLRWRATPRPARSTHHSVAAAR